MLLFGAPIIQLFLFGYVVTTDVNNISTALYDLDRSRKAGSWQGGWSLRILCGAVRS